MKKLIQNTLWCIGIIGTLAVGVVNADVTLTYNPNAGITYTDTNGKVFKNIGTITIAQGDKSITILDRNLGATTNDITNTGSYGYHFQWGNNYGFTWVENDSDEFAGDETIGTDIANTSGNARNNPYVSSEYIMNPYGGWDDPHNYDLWGGANDRNNGWGDSSADYKRQGPCPAGYHVPSQKELDDLLQMYYEYNPSGDLEERDDYGHYIFDSTFSTNFCNDFKIPFAGLRAVDGNGLIDGVGYVGYWRSSSAADRNVDSHVLHIQENGVYANFTDFCGYARSVRCFLDSTLDDSGTQPLILEYETNGGSPIQSQTIPVGEKAYLPGYTTQKEGSEFIGWFNEDGTEQYNLSSDNEFVFEDLTLQSNMATDGVVKIYAKWGYVDGITVDSDAGITYTDTNGKVFENIGTITIKSGDDSITILDRNLGAITNDITNSDSYGYYFQWGNNYGFTPDDFTLGYTTFEATDYSWDNPYVSGNFIAAKYWDTSYNSGLWGGSDDYDNDRGIDTSDGGYARQGPCPAGYHVPSIGEFDELMRIFKSITGGTAQLQTGTNGNLVESNPFANAFTSELHFPIAGFIGWDGVYTGISDTNYSYSYFWSSSFMKANGYLMINHHPKASKKDKVSTRGNNFQQGNAFSIRCFKNTSEDGEEIVLSYDTRGGSAIQAQTLPVGGTGYLPGYTTHRENVELLGWYDEDLLTEFNFEDTILNEDTVIYAKWSDDYVVTFLDFDGSVLKTEVVKHGNEATSPNVSDRDGYEFNGWDVDFSNITEDTTITAQYTPIEYDITYVLNGGTNNENNTGKYTIETPTITLYDADRKGYDFNGWFSDPEFTNQITEITQGSTGDVTLYANWTKKYTGYSGRGHDKKQDETEQDDEPNEIDNTSINTDEPSEEQNYSQEIINAYDFAYKNGITTMDTIEKVEMVEPLTRISMAKMLSQYAINVLGKKPANIVVPDFSDINPELDEEYANAITLAYQLGIMGINIQEFRPFDTVIRAEFATALSRMLYSTPDGEYEGTAEYYVNHIKKLVEEKIITNNDPFLQELRGYVMIILMRTAE